MNGLAVYVKWGCISFAQDLSLENSEGSFLFIFSAGLAPVSLLLLFSVLITFFDIIHSF